MAKRLLKKRWIVGSLILGLVGVAVLGGTAFAQTPQPTPDSPAAKQSPKDRLLSKVATILGIEESRLQEAVKQATKEIQDEDVKAQLDRAVANGRLTQEKADEYYKWYQARPEGGPGFLPGIGGKGHPQHFRGPMPMKRGWGRGPMPFHHPFPPAPAPEPAPTTTGVNL